MPNKSLHLTFPAALENAGELKTLPIMKIRRASYKDIDPPLNLMHELGYPSKKDVIIESIAEYNRSTGYEAFVAEDEGKVIDISCRTKLCACDFLRNQPDIVVFQS